MTQAILYLLYAGLITRASVVRLPNIIVQPEKVIYFIQGEEAHITCVGDGSPKPTYKWKRNGINFSPSGNDDRVAQLPDQGTIVFSKPESKDEGTFQCFADNGYGTAASDTVLFREAKLPRFVDEERTVHYINNSAPATLPCAPPINSAPPCEVVWVIKSNDSFEEVNLDKRITMDLTAGLRFTHVMPSDEQDGKTYACIAINSFLKKNVTGPEHQIVVQGDIAQNQTIIELWTSPKYMLILKGASFRMKCIFAGNPTPDVYWEKLDDNLPDRATFKSFGQELHITNVQESDAGLYECMGLINGSKKWKQFDVAFRSAPEWVSEPASQVKRINETAIFHCEVNSNPASQYVWFINGVPLEDRRNQEGVRDPRIYKNPRFTSTPNTLTLRNLTLEDHMNIQCNASNIHGYAFADVYLNVVAGEAPTILVHPPPSVKVMEGNSATIPCVATGEPDPVIEWYRYTSRVAGERFKIMSNGSLVILNAERADAGNYTCRASNSIETDVSSSVCNVQVTRQQNNHDTVSGSNKVVQVLSPVFFCVIMFSFYITQ